MTDTGITQLSFNNAAIKAIVTTCGDKKVDFLSNYKDFGLTDSEASRLAKVMGLSSRYVVSDETVTTSDLCYQSALNLLNGMKMKADDLDGLILVTQSQDFSSPSSAINLQNRLGMKHNSICFDIKLGCSGFVYGLSCAYGYIEAGCRNILLCVGDVASRLVNPNDHVVAPIMGDAGSAILISNERSQSIFNLFSDGSGYDALIIPNSGLRVESKFEGKDPHLIMDGASVFDFTLKRVPSLISNIMDASKLSQEKIDYFVLHQPNKYMLQNIKKRMDIPDSKVPHETQSVYGNQNSASIPGTINGFLSDEYSSKRLTSLFAGFGVGLSWGAAVLETNEIFSPATYFFEGN